MILGLDRLGVSRSLIALYLKEARDHEIVKIEIINPGDSCASLALDLRRRANLEQVVVVPHGHLSQELTRRAVAAAAAQHLDSQLHDGDVLGLGWGRTTNRVVELLAPTQPRDIEVIPLLGESSYTGSYTQINQIVLQTAQHYNGRPSFLLSPMLVGSRKLRDLLFEDNVVRDVDLLFFGLALVAVASAVGMLLSKNAIYSALNLIMNFIAIAVFYLLLGAPFIAVAQVAVYAGAIKVLFLFVIMLLGAERAAGQAQSIPWQRPLAIALGIILLVESGFSLASQRGMFPFITSELAADFGSPAQIGSELFSRYLLPFEVTSVLLLVAMIGAIVLTKNEKK